MITCYVSSNDGLRIAYDFAGDAGPTLLLLHGFSTDRRVWRVTGLIERLSRHFRVVTVDLRGCGESDSPPDPSAYGVDRHLADVEAVAEACGTERYLVWGWSFGATIGLHLAAHSARLVGAVIAGTVFGRVYSEERIQALIAEGEALAAAQAQGRLDELTAEQRAFVARTDLSVWLARQRGFATWPGLEPHELSHPVLVYTGTADEPVVTRLEPYRVAMATAGIQYRVFEGLDHWGLIAAGDVVLPQVLPYLQGLGAGRWRWAP